MKSPALPFALAAALVLLAPPAAAQLVAVRAICEPTDATHANTVKINLLSPSVLDFMFKKLPSGPTTIYPAGPFTISLVRLFSLPQGTYQISFKHPSGSSIGTYSQTVTVNPYLVRNGRCMTLNINNRSQVVGGAQQ
jgi:hypothetical protein